jgi:hypothetical protein
MTRLPDTASVLFVVHYVVSRFFSPFHHQGHVMKKLCSLAVTCSLLFSVAAHAQDANLDQARQAATVWLAFSDANDYGQSWEHSADMLKQSIEKAKWQDAMQHVRTPLGTVKQRQIKSAELKKDPPGAPAGDYAIIQYDTDFSNRAHSVETVVPARDKDGNWLVSGYFIR